jgi:chemotaxis protein CheD
VKRTQAAAPISRLLESRPRVSRESLFLHPGDLVASFEDVEIVTILGSCVAVCVCDRFKHIGGMNHFQMPGVGDQREPLRYGPSATRMLVDRVVELGAKRQRLEAKVFGGASILRGSAPPPGGLGDENAATALRTLDELRIRVASQDIGGHRARKLVYRIKDGSAWVKPIRRTPR